MDQKENLNPQTKVAEVQFNTSADTIIYPACCYIQNYYENIENTGYNFH